MRGVKWEGAQFRWRYNLTKSSMNKLNENMTGTKNTKASELRRYLCTVTPHVFLRFESYTMKTE